MKELNFVEILKLGLTGLGFLLALLSYFLLKQELKREYVRSTVISSIRSFMVFSLAMALLTLFWEILKQPENIRMMFGSKEMNVNALKPVDVSSLNPEEYYINSDYDFALKKIKGSPWSEVERVDNPFKVIKDVESDSTRTILTSYSFTISMSPLKDMLYNQQSFRMTSLKNVLDMEFTDSTKNENVSFAMNYSLNYLLYEIDKQNRLDTSEVTDVEKFKKEFTQLQKQVYKTPPFSFANHITVHVLNKKHLPLEWKDMSVADLFKQESFAAPSYSEILTKGRTIYVKGISAKFSNVLINQKVGDFQSDALEIYSENSKYFYHVVMSYSPQASNRTQEWSDLQEVLESFSILRD